MTKENKSITQKHPSDPPYVEVLREQIANLLTESKNENQSDTLQKITFRKLLRLCWDIYYHDVSYPPKPESCATTTSTNNTNPQTKKKSKNTQLRNDYFFSWLNGQVNNELYRKLEKQKASLDNKAKYGELVGGTAVEKKFWSIKDLVRYELLPYLNKKDKKALSLAGNRYISHVLCYSPYQTPRSEEELDFIINSGLYKTLRTLDLTRLEKDLTLKDLENLKRFRRLDLLTIKPMSKEQLAYIVSGCFFDQSELCLHFSGGESWIDFDTVKKLLEKGCKLHFHQLYYSFFGSLENLEIPKGLSVKEVRLLDCGNLSEFTIPEGVSIEELHFDECSKLKKLDIAKGLRLKKVDLWECGNLSEFTIPEGVSIEGLYLQSCSKLKKLDIAKGVKLKNVHLSDCGDLDEFTIPEGVSIEELLFEGCSKLKKLDIAKGLRLKKVHLSNCGDLDEFTIPEGVSIEELLFESCSKLKKLDIAKGLRLKKVHLSNCGDLSEFTIPEGVSIEELYLISSKLKKLDIAKGVKLKKARLLDCGDLSEFTIPEGVSIEELYLISSKINSTVLNEIAKLQSLVSLNIISVKNVSLASLIPIVFRNTRLKFENCELVRAMKDKISPVFKLRDKLMNSYCENNNSLGTDLGLSDEKMKLMGTIVQSLAGGDISTDKQNSDDDYNSNDNDKNDKVRSSVNENFKFKDDPFMDAVLKKFQEIFPEKCNKPDVKLEDTNALQNRGTSQSQDSSIT